MQISYISAQTPLGTVMLAATARGVCFIQITDDKKDFLKDIQGKYRGAELVPASGESLKKLNGWIGGINKYLSGKSEFPKLPLDVKGTDFQLKIWKQLQKIPSGELQSYAQVAKAAGVPKAVRAVASACARNSIALAIPCHRVIHSDGSISGYRWGVKRKRELIELEQLSA